MCGACPAVTWLHRVLRGIFLVLRTSGNFTHPTFLWVEGLDSIVELQTGQRCRMTARQALGTANGACSRLPQTDVVRTAIAPFRACARFSQRGRKSGCAMSGNKSRRGSKSQNVIAQPHRLVKFSRPPVQTQKPTWTPRRVESGSNGSGFWGSNPTVLPLARLRGFLSRDSGEDRLGEVPGTLTPNP